MILLSSSILNLHIKTEYILAATVLTVLVVLRMPVTVLRMLLVLLCSLCIGGVPKGARRIGVGACMHIQARNSVKQVKHADTDSDTLTHRPQHGGAFGRSAVGAGAARVIK